jgi:hypothetical protein
LAYIQKIDRSLPYVGLLLFFMLLNERDPCVLKDVSIISCVQEVEKKLKELHVAPLPTVICEEDVASLVISSLLGGA